MALFWLPARVLPTLALLAGQAGAGFALDLPSLLRVKLALMQLTVFIAILASVRGLSGSPTRRKLLLGGAGAAVALPALAEDDEAARAAALQAKLAERRKLMELSRSSNDRQRYFDLSRQRASVVYNTTSKAASCVPGLPCI